MIDRLPGAGAAIESLSAPEKARLIYETARAEMSAGLWHAALGEAGREADATGLVGGGKLETRGLDLMLAQLTGAGGQASGAQDVVDFVTAPKNDVPLAMTAGAGTMAEPVGGDGPTGKGVNARFIGLLDAAARRTGLPPSALAAIVDAEAAKGADGSWQTYSRNPRSSAAGLGQFLKGTWESEAERSGTWLNATAGREGWLDDRGRVAPGSRAALLALRYDPRAAIEAVADYAGANLSVLREAGGGLGEGAEGLARAAYLGHHLGPGDARTFIAGGLSPERARKLLAAQVGAGEAERRIAREGGAVTAHRTWLLDYLGRHVRPEKFAHSFK